jgi:aquaglyceroporin related protein
MAASHSSESITHAEKTTTIIPVDKIEHAGSMSQDENASTTASKQQTLPEHAYEELWWPKRREFFQDYFSEFAGTMIMILFGDGVVAQVVLSENEKGDYQSISWGWG